MKIFSIGSQYEANRPSSLSQIQLPLSPAVMIKCDTAVLKGSKPFFVPDHLGDVNYQAALIVRICKLGKTIPQRFAHRYYDAYTVGVNFEAITMKERLASVGLPQELAYNFDGSCVIGNWIEKDSCKPYGQLDFHLCVNSEDAPMAYTHEMTYDIDEIVAYISEYFTLKTGDLICMEAKLPTALVAINDHIEGYLGEQRVLSFNCK